jgi:2'-5' RNA ligase
MTAGERKALDSRMQTQDAPDWIDRDVSRRLFFALDPDRLQRQSIAGALRPALAGVEGWKVASARLHLTLIFLGMTSPSKFSCVRQTAAGVRGIPFELTLYHIGYWSRSEVLWVAPQPSAVLFGLYAALRAALARCDVALQARRYHPHVTLVRKLIRAPEPVPEIVPIPWKVKDFVLMESGAGGYRVLERWELR